MTSSALYFHVIPRSDLPSVYEHGLDHKRRSTRDWRGCLADMYRYPRGNYVTNDLKAARGYAWVLGTDGTEMAIIELNLDGAQLLPDPDPEWRGVGFYTKETLPPATIVGEVSLQPEISEVELAPASAEAAITAAAFDCIER